MQRALSITIQVLVLLLLLSMLAGVLLVVTLFTSLANAPGQAAGDLGSRLTGAVGGTQRAIQNVTDPNRPPTDLTYDTEFSSLQTWKVGGRLPEGAHYVLTLQSIGRREGASSPDIGLYAVIHAELRQPRETVVFGQVIHTDSDPHDHVVYKGETFRIGRALYRVNWVSQEDAAMAAGMYRRPDAVSAHLAFDYD